MSASFTLRARRSQYIHFGVAESRYFNTAHLPTPCECTNLGTLIIQAILYIRKTLEGRRLLPCRCSNLGPLMIQEVSKYRLDSILIHSLTYPLIHPLTHILKNLSTHLLNKSFASKLKFDRFELGR